MSDAAQDQGDRCPYCGYPKNRHTYASRTSCVVEGPKPTLDELREPPTDGAATYD